MALFTTEELEELRRADEELDSGFVQSQEEIEESRMRDRMSRLSNLDNKGRKLAEHQKAYYEANKEKLAEYQKAYREANREKYNAYMRSYLAARRAKKKAVSGS